MWSSSRGLAGLGGFGASIGVTKVTSQDKLCPQYLVRTDTMEYHIRPMDKKHPTVPPVGHEALFQIHNDRMFLRVEDLDKKVRQYQVVAEKALSERPLNQDTGDRSRGLLCPPGAEISPEPSRLWSLASTTEPHFVLNPGTGLLSSLPANYPNR